MKRFVIERNLPGAGELSDEEIQTISQTWSEAANKLGKPHIWVQSFIGEDKIYCVHIAENEEMVREHARITKSPINTVSEIKKIIDPTNSNPLPAA
jgi:hypothetical protein